MPSSTCEAVGEFAVLDGDAELGAAGADAAGRDEDVWLAARGFVELAYEARGAVEVAALEVEVVVDVDDFMYLRYRAVRDHAVGLEEDTFFVYLGPFVEVGGVGPEGARLYEAEGVLGWLVGEFDVCGDAHLRFEEFQHFFARR